MLETDAQESFVRTNLVGLGCTAELLRAEGRMSRKSRALWSNDGLNKSIREFQVIGVLLRKPTQKSALHALVLFSRLSDKIELT